MSGRLHALTAAYLTQHGALAPATLGGSTDEAAPGAAGTLDAAAQDAFLLKVQACGRSARAMGWVLVAVHLLLLIGLLVLLIAATSRGADAVATTVLGGSFTAGLGLIPLRLHALWKDYEGARLMLAAIPGRPPAVQLDLIKAFYFAGKVPSAPS